MGIFQPGDKITRLNQNSWWKKICSEHNIPLNGVFTVMTCCRDTVKCYGWSFRATPENFTLIDPRTKEDIIAARIKKLYSKCKTTAHWV